VNKASFFATHTKSNFLLYILVIFSSLLFFYRLDYHSLTSWDEAWYGSIAREIIITNDWINLQFNGKDYLEWQLPLFYLHMGIRKWYYIWLLTFMILSIGAFGYLIYGLTLLTKKKKFDHKENVILVIRNGIVDNYQKAGLPYKLKAKNNSFSIITER